MSPDAITLTLTEHEAAAVATALVSVIHSEGPAWMVEAAVSAAEKLGRERERA